WSRLVSGSRTSHSSRRAGVSLVIWSGLSPHGFANPFEVRLRVHRNPLRTATCLDDEDRNPILQGAQLFETLDLFEVRNRQGRKPQQARASVRVDAHVFEHAKMSGTVA